MLEPHIWKPSHDPPRGLMPLMTIPETKMTEAEVQALREENERLRKEVGALNLTIAKQEAELTDLRGLRQRSSGMGIQQNQPEVFAELRGR